MVLCAQLFNYMYNSSALLTMLKQVTYHGPSIGNLRQPASFLIITHIYGVSNLATRNQKLNVSILSKGSANHLEFTVVADEEEGVAHLVQLNAPMTFVEKQRSGGGVQYNFSSARSKICRNVHLCKKWKSGCPDFSFFGNLDFIVCSLWLFSNSMSEEKNNEI